MSNAARETLGDELYERVCRAFVNDYTVNRFALGYLRSDMHRGILMELLKEQERARGVYEGAGDGDLDRDRGGDRLVRRPDLDE